MAMTWHHLSTLRCRGLRPTLPMIVTTNPMIARSMIDVGCVAILHEPGSPMPVRWLDGLDVILDVGGCQRAAAVKRLMDRQGAAPSWCRAWCPCAAALVVTVGECGDELWNA